MENIHHRINRHLFVLFDHLDRKLHPDDEEYRKVREERLIQLFKNSIKVKDYEIFPN